MCHTLGVHHTMLASAHAAFMVIHAVTTYANHKRQVAGRAGCATHRAHPSMRPDMQPVLQADRQADKTVPRRCLMRFVVSCTNDTSHPRCIRIHEEQPYTIQITEFRTGELRTAPVEQSFMPRVTLPIAPCMLVARQQHTFSWVLEMLANCTSP